MKKLTTKTSGIFFAVAAIALGIASAAHAQDRVDAKLPFAFLVNGVQLPAGAYEVKVMSEGSGVLTSPSNEEGDPKLLFDKINNLSFANTTIGPTSLI